MKFLPIALIFAAIGANAQSLSTVLAPCGTSCPSAAPDKLITRSAPPPTETSPCPSLLVSSIATKNGTSGVTTGSPPTPTHFAGGANHLAVGSFGGAALAAAAVAFAL